MCHHGFMVRGNVQCFVAEPQPAPSASAPPSSAPLDPLMLMVYQVKTVLPHASEEDIKRSLGNSIPLLIKSFSPLPFLFSIFNHNFLLVSR